MIINVSIAEAHERLPALLDAVEAGDQVLIRGPSGGAFRLVSALPPRGPATGVPRRGVVRG